MMAIVCIVLGVIALVLNAVILIILLKQHVKMMQHVFYMLITNFTAIDTLKVGDILYLLLWSGH